MIKQKKTQAMDDIKRIQLKIDTIQKLYLDTIKSQTKQLQKMHETKTGSVQYAEAEAKMILCARQARLYKLDKRKLELQISMV